MQILCIGFAAGITLSPMRTQPLVVKHACNCYEYGSLCSG
jgi:hypothetical protein